MDNSFDNWVNGKVLTFNDSVGSDYSTWLEGSPIALEGVLDEIGPISVSKAVAYAVLSAPDGANVSKAVAYAVLSTEVTVGISKAVAYVVLSEYIPSSSNQPILMIIT